MLSFLADRTQVSLQIGHKNTGQMEDMRVNSLTGDFAKLFRKSGTAGFENLRETVLNNEDDVTLSQLSAEIKDSLRGRSASLVSNDSGLGDCEVDPDLRQDWR